MPPFRESKLTMLLKEALGGNSVTTVLACVSPDADDLEETIGTLEFASRCKLVKTNACRSERMRRDLKEHLESEKGLLEAQLVRERTEHAESIDRLRAELYAARCGESAAQAAEHQEMNVPWQLRHELTLKEQLCPSSPSCRNGRFEGANTEEVDGAVAAVGERRRRSLLRKDSPDLALVEELRAANERLNAEQAVLQDVVSQQQLARDQLRSANDALSDSELESHKLRAANDTLTSECSLLTIALAEQEAKERNLLVAKKRLLLEGSELMVALAKQQAAADQLCMANVRLKADRAEVQATHEDVQDLVAKLAARDEMLSVQGRELAELRAALEQRSAAPACFEDTTTPTRNLREAASASLSDLEKVCPEHAKVQVARAMQSQAMLVVVLLVMVALLLLALACTLCPSTRGLGSGWAWASCAASGGRIEIGRGM